MAMDPVNKKALKKDFDDRADKDIDNDGDTDKTDEYLHKRRKAVSKAIGKMKESVEIFESHFKVGDEVECIDSGMEGKVIKVDPEEKGKYYTVKREDGKIVKYAPDELRAEDDDDEEKDDDDMKEAKTASQHRQSMIDKIKKSGAVKSGSMAKEEVELDEVLDTPERMDSYRNKAKASKERAAKSAVATTLRSKNKGMRAHPAKDLKTIAKRTAGEKMADRNAARKFRKMNKEEVEQIDEISKKTLARYVDRAANDATIKAYKAGDVRDKNATKNYMKSLQRQLGIKKALKKLTKEELNVSDGMGAWIDDFKKSDAPQFKGKDDKERREMAVAAFLAAKRAGKE